MSHLIAVHNKMPIATTQKKMHQDNGGPALEGHDGNGDSWLRVLPSVRTHGNNEDAKSAAGVALRVHHGLQ